MIEGKISKDERRSYISDARRFKILKWLGESPLDRMPEIQFRKTIGMSANHWQDVVADIRTQVKANTLTVPQVATKLARDFIQESLDGKPLTGQRKYDSETYLKSKQQVADEALMREVLKGNTNAIKLFLQRLGLLVEKQEVSIGLTASETARRNLEAERQLREAGYGHRVEEMPEESTLLPGELRVDTGQDKASGSKVGKMASPVKDN